MYCPSVQYSQVSDTAKSGYEAVFGPDSDSRAGSVGLSYKALKTSISKWFCTAE
jgi:hypothetical protein